MTHVYCCCWRRRRKSECGSTSDVRSTVRSTRQRIALATRAPWFHERCVVIDRNQLKDSITFRLTSRDCLPGQGRGQATFCVLEVSRRGAKIKQRRTDHDNRRGAPNSARGYKLAGGDLLLFRGMTFSS